MFNFVLPSTQLVINPQSISKEIVMSESIMNHIMQIENHQNIFRISFNSAETQVLDRVTVLPQMIMTDEDMSQLLKDVKDGKMPQQLDLMGNPIPTETKEDKDKNPKDKK